jgi:CheY-like chemotaxis protein
MKEQEYNRSSPGVEPPPGLAANWRFVTALHVDDDPNDTALLQAACRKANVGLDLQNVGDGEQAIDYLSGFGPFADRHRFPMPTMVLLDLKMPKATGFEILRWIRAHPNLSHLPVIVLSGSELQDDIRQAYAAGANSYLVKPLGFDALVELIKTVSNVWTTANVPKPGQAGEQR